MKIAVVDDDVNYLNGIKDYIARFEKESGEQCSVFTFENGMDFITDYEPKYDLIILDIKMPFMNGMTVAEKLRKLDEDVALIFMTSMAQYAIRGYAVSALDFAVKPVAYSDFAAKMKKALNYVRSHSEKFIVVQSSAGMLKKIGTKKIKYVEVMGHSLIYHCKDEEVTCRGQLVEAEKELDLPNFLKCNKCYIVNLDYVTGVVNDGLIVGEETLSVSRRRKKEILQRMSEYWGGGAAGCSGT